MTKRIKRVFSNEQACHVWAQQTQDHGKSGSIFFEGTEIYSYGRHYLMAKIHILKSGKRVALVNSHRYSRSTIKHIYCTHRALTGLMPMFNVSNPRDLKQAIKDLDAQARASFQAPLKRLKITSKDEIKYQFERIHAAYRKANELRKLLGRAEVWPKKKELDKVQAHLDARLKRYKELNTPEKIAAKAAEKTQRELIEAKKRELENRLEIERFRAGEKATVRTNHALLRVKNGIVQTSRGAEVPLDAAVQAYRLFKQGGNLVGFKLGHFTVEGVEYLNNETKFIIGCHEILLSEVERLLEMKVA